MPLRKCIGCNEIKDTYKMIRIIKLHDTREIVINPNSHHFGRSSYLCYNKECIQNALKKKRIQKTLKMEIPIHIVEKIKTLTEN